MTSSIGPRGAKLKPRSLRLLLSTSTSHDLSFSSSRLQKKKKKKQIVLTSDADWGLNSTRCAAMVDRAAALGQKRVMFTPTLYFVDREPKPAGTPEEHSRVSYFCYARDSWGGCPPATLAQREFFTESMRACLARAVQRGMDLAVAPHVDDGALGGRWRQGLVFDPLARFGARFGGADLSYDEFILQPLATAVAAVVAPTTKVWFATQGVSLSFFLFL